MVSPMDARQKEQGRVCEKCDYAGDHIFFACSRREAGDGGTRRAENVLDVLSRKHLIFRGIILHRSWYCGVTSHITE